MDEVKTRKQEGSKSKIAVKLAYSSNKANGATYRNVDLEVLKGSV